jgi:hypothetical protein
MKCRPNRDIIWLFITTRLVLAFITYSMYILLSGVKNYSRIPVDIVGLFTTWNHWDAANYICIAQYGYQTIYDLAFFPLFPLLIACISWLLGSWSYLLVGTLISNLALFGALWIIYHLVSKRLSDTVAHHTLIYLCVFPTAFFFFAAYNESLYLLLAAGTFLALENERWWLAGLLGLLAALTRSIGILLLVPYIYELWIRRQRVFTQPLIIIKSVLPSFLLPLGTGLYAIYCWQMFGNPLAFATVQSHWGRSTQFPWVGILHTLQALFGPNAQPFGSVNEANMLLNLSITLGCIALTILGWRKLPTSYSLWTGACLLFILSSPAIIKPDALLSNQRFALELFPIFITLAIITEKHPRFHYASVLIFATLLGVLATAFIMNRWIV